MLLTITILASSRSYSEWKQCLIGRIPKQSHYVRYQALELLCTNLCGPLTKKFGDPWCRATEIDLQSDEIGEFRMLETRVMQGFLKESGKTPSLVRLLKCWGSFLSLSRLFAERQCWALTGRASWFPSALRSPERALPVGRTYYLLLCLLLVVVIAHWFGFYCRILCGFNAVLLCNGRFWDGFTSATSAPLWPVTSRDHP